MFAVLPAASGGGRVSAADEPLAFHHLHLNDPNAPFLLEFYERLFDPSSTRRLRVGDADALQSGGMLLVISGAPPAPVHPSALWHFGWGDVSLGDTYLAHAAREVAWEPPLPPDRLHLHLRSVSPPAAVAWYRDILGARVEVAGASARRGEPLPRPEHRSPEALVWIGGLGVLIYRADPPLVTSRGQTADHVGVSCLDLDATLVRLRASGVRVLTPPALVGDFRAAMIEGPDRLAIELVQRP